MSVAFGTSGLRGLARALTDDLIQSYIRAFLDACPRGAGLFIAQDLRASSPRIAAAAISAARSCGVDVTDCGAVPTPALALAAAEAGASALMVTGSHIPGDRNGLKFYTPVGEITKGDEVAILAALGKGATARAQEGRLIQWAGAGAHYVARYAAAFGPQALAGLRLGVYQHSSVARDILVDLVTGLGGQAVLLARADHFIPVDTEALDAQTRAMLAGWVADFGLDAVLSTDGDGDRPMLAGSDGQIIAGDVLGALTARAMGAEVICTPVSSNSMIEEIGGFRIIVRCKIGSPYVIAAMDEARADDPAAKVAGFEANGGFLLGFTAQAPQGPLSPLMTRDAALPLIAPLAHARSKGQKLADLLASLPARASAADRLTNIPPHFSAAFLTALADDKKRAAFLAPFGLESALNTIDGLRMTLVDGRVLHLRASGNAPEFRVYVEAQDRAAAQDLLRTAMPLCAGAIEKLRQDR